MFLAVAFAILIMIGILYFTCGRLGYIINLLIYLLSSYLLILIFPGLKIESTSNLIYLGLKFFIGIVLIKRLIITYERIGSPIAFFLTGFILESLSVYILYKYLDNEYFWSFIVAYIIVSIIFFIGLINNSELSNSNSWTRDNQMNLEGKTRINEPEIKRGVFWEKWYK